MGQDDDLATSLAHIALCCVAGRGLSRMSGKSFTHPGMHANFFIHGLVGLAHYQSGTFGEIGGAYAVSYKASRYLALPCLMADIYSGDQALCTLFLASGLIPFTMAIAGTENAHLGNLCVAINVVGLAHYSLQNKRDWGWFTAAASVFAYFVAPPSGLKILYPLGLAAMEYCAYRVFHAQFDIVDPREARRARRGA